MRRLLSSRFVMPIVAVILLAALLPLTQPYRHSAAWRVPPEHQPHVDRALAGAAEMLGVSSEDYRRITRPRVERDRLRTCVTLATYRSDRGGSYMRCHDNRTGAVILERGLGIPFGAEGLWDRFGHLVW